MIAKNRVVGDDVLFFCHKFRNLVMRYSRSRKFSLFLRTKKFSEVM